MTIGVALSRSIRSGDAAWWIFVLLAAAMLCGSALAEDARRLRIEAAALVQAAENERSVQERQALLKRAHGKLVAIQDRYPSASADIQLYLGGDRVRLTPADVHLRFRAAAFADGIHADDLPGFLGRELSATEADENGWTDLHWAAALNLPDLAEALVKAGADVEARYTHERISEKLRRSLSAAGLDASYYYYGDFELVGNGLGLSPLSVAALEDAETVVSVLLAAGAEVDATNDDGETALHHAASHNAVNGMKALMAAGADVDARDHSGFSPLHFAFWIEATEVLIAAGADVHAKDRDGRTPLYWAAGDNMADVATVLIASGADIHAKDSTGQTPLDIAAQSESQEVLAILKKEQERKRQR